MVYPPDPVPDPQEPADELDPAELEEVSDDVDLPADDAVPEPPE